MLQPSVNVSIPVSRVLHIISLVVSLLCSYVQCHCSAQNFFRQNPYALTVVCKPLITSEGL